jgi:UDP-2-acetamido-3-amino-2,3-dideoxy-glucuronate N-acetyltransferase
VAAPDPSRTRIDPSATVEAGAEVGEGCTVWAGATVRSGAVLGPRCTLGRGAYVDAGVQVGPDAKIQDQALVYAPATLGDGVFLGPGVILTNDRRPRAVGPDLTKKAAGDWAAEGVAVGDGAAIGAGSVVVAGVTVGRWALVGAGSVVTRDVPDFALVVGNPARRIGWVGRAGTRLEQDGDDRLRCPVTGQGFRIVGETIEEEEEAQ